MAINKVVYGSNTLIDLTEDTVTAETLAAGATAHDRSGAAIMGTLQETSLLYFNDQGVNVASQAEIIRIPSSGTDESISTDTILVSCHVADRENVAPTITWTSYTGYMSISGTCTAATTADVVLGKKGN